MNQVTLMITPAQARWIMFALGMATGEMRRYEPPTTAMVAAQADLIALASKVAWALELPMKLEATPEG